MRKEIYQWVLIIYGWGLSDFKNGKVTFQSI